MMNETKNEVKKEAKVLTLRSDEFFDITERFSSFNRLIRVIARILRWKNHATGEFLPEELWHAEKTAVKIVQKAHFSTEIERMNKNLTLKRELAILFPFVDNEGILRVRGRLAMLIRDLLFQMWD